MIVVLPLRIMWWDWYFAHNQILLGQRTMIKTIEFKTIKLKGDSSKDQNSISLGRVPRENNADFQSTLSTKARPPIIKVGSYTRKYQKNFATRIM